MPGRAAGAIGPAPVDSATVTTRAPRHRRLTAFLLGLAAAWLLAGPVLGHASLASSDPADGSSVPFPSSITLTFDDDLDAAKSQFGVVDATGAAVATGHVSASDAKTMQATGLSLTLGPCQVRWTAVASDGDLTRGTVSFTVIQAGAVSIEPTASTGAVSPSPAASDGGAGGVAARSGDVVLPIAAALVLVAVVGVVILRRSRTA
jgi:copper resistance protein C